jgi:hypothetical protein
MQDARATTDNVPPAGDTSSSPRPRLVGARIFVLVAFLLLAAAFVASTWLLVSEFRASDPLTLALAHSHLFIFFPTFGLLALAAFFLPSVIFTDLYWYHIPYGRIRFLFGFAVVIAISAWVSLFVLGEQASPRALWELSPRTLAADQGVPPNCVANKQLCTRAPIATVLDTLRNSAQQTNSLSKFGRACNYDRLLEEPKEHKEERWCFPAHRKLKTEDCCKAQEAFTKIVNEKAGGVATRSALAVSDRYLQALKTFFVLVVLIIGVMLVVWQHRVRHHYPSPKLYFRMERHIFIGALAMLLWPVMDYAYLDTSNALFGRWTADLQPRLSLVVVPWSLLLLFYYLQRFARRVEVIGQIVTVAGTLLAVIARDEIKDWGVRLLGVGMPWWMGMALAVAWLGGMIAVFAPERWMPPPPQQPPLQPGHVFPSSPHA